MNIKKFAKICLVIVSVTMFMVQFRLAVLNLIDPPTVDSSYERDITVDDLPIITVCPIVKLNNESLYQLQYFYKHNILYGFVNWNKVSWGAHKNLTFEEVLKQVFDEKPALDMFLDTTGSQKQVFLPMYGFCKEVQNYNDVADVNIELSHDGKAMVFFTDKLYRSYFMLDISSHVGSRVLILPTQAQHIQIKIQVKSTCKSNKIDFTYEDYNQCITKELNDTFVSTVGCIPPMLSSENQCDEIYNTKKFNEISNWKNQIIKPLEKLVNNQIEMNCRKSCFSTKYFVNERGIEEYDYNSNYHAQISFDQKVLVTEKVDNYNLFQFIIDVGFSLGLWLGLSVLGLHDLVVTVVEFIKNSLICRQISNALQQ